MQLNYLSGNDFIKMMTGGAKLLSQRKKEVDALNVFPVPDGDTGTNMSLTILAAVKEGNTKPNEDLGKTAQTISMGSLMGARGNSGVILSQILRGISKGFEGKAHVNAKEVAKALQEGANTAYKGVLKPVEGTILTVAREIGNSALQASFKTNDIITLLELAYKGGEEALAKTPELLPVLKQVGVVDAGGKGLLVILEGAIKALKGEDIFIDEKSPTESEDVSSLTFVDDTSSTEITFQYCTEFLVKGTNLPLEKMRSEIGNFGDSLMVVGTEEVVKVHVHSNHPGEVLEYCLKIGSLHEIKIGNMVEQNQDMTLNQASENTKPFGVIAVSVGDGLRQILLSLGVDQIIEGGQTLNPSTEDIVKAIKELKTSKVIVLPNNKNIILAAQQAKDLVEAEVVVIPTKSIPQGITALISMDQRVDFDVAVSKMEEAIDQVITGEITYAVRDSQYDGISIREGDILGLIDGQIEVAGETIKEAAFKLLNKAVVEDKELVTVYYGKEVTVEEAEGLLQELQQEYPDLEFELHQGGQPLYYYLISME